MVKSAIFAKRSSALVAVDYKMDRILKKGATCRHLRHHPEQQMSRQHPQTDTQCLGGGVFRLHKVFTHHLVLHNPINNSCKFYGKAEKRFL